MATFHVYIISHFLPTYPIFYEVCLNCIVASVTLQPCNMVLPLLERWAQAGTGYLTVINNSPVLKKCRLELDKTAFRSDEETKEVSNM